MRMINGRAEWRDRDAHTSLDRPEDVQQLLGDLGTLIQGVTLATHDFGQVTSRLRGSLSDMAEAVTDAWHVTRRHGGGALKAAGEAIDSRPYVAIGLAAALGVVAGFVVQRGVHSLGQSNDEDDGWDHFV